MTNGIRASDFSDMAGTIAVDFPFTSYLSNPLESPNSYYPCVYKPPPTPSYVYHTLQPPPPSPPYQFYNTPYSSTHLPVTGGLPRCYTYQAEGYPQLNHNFPPPTFQSYNAQPTSNCPMSPFITATHISPTSTFVQQPEIFEHPVFDESPEFPVPVSNSIVDNMHQTEEKITEMLYTLEKMGKIFADSPKLVEKKMVGKVDTADELDSQSIEMSSNKAYCTQGKMDGALDVLNIITSKEMMPNCFTYNILLDAYCKQLKMDIAMDLYRNMVCEGLEPTVETHNILLHGLCWLGKPMEALAFFYKIQDQGHMLDNVTYGTMLHGLCKNQFVDKALSLFHLMRCSGVIPDKDTYNIIIRGCLQNKKYNEACKLVDKMVYCGFLADAVTSSLLQRLLLSEVQDPTLLKIHQKCLCSGFTALWNF